MGVDQVVFVDDMPALPENPGKEIPLGTRHHILQCGAIPDTKNPCNHHSLSTHAMPHISLQEYRLYLPGTPAALIHFFNNTLSGSRDPPRENHPEFL